MNTRCAIHTFRPIFEPKTKFTVKKPSAPPNWIMIWWKNPKLGSRIFVGLKYGWSQFAQVLPKYDPFHGLYLILTKYLILIKTTVCSLPVSIRRKWTIERKWRCKFHSQVNLSNNQIQGLAMNVVWKNNGWRVSCKTEYFTFGNIQWVLFMPIIYLVYLPVFPHSFEFTN